VERKEEEEQGNEFGRVLSISITEFGYYYDTSKYACTLQWDHNSLCYRQHEHGCTTKPHVRHYEHNEVARTCGHGTTCV
jgi:hypothetical protein